MLFWLIPDECGIQCPIDGLYLKQAIAKLGQYHNKNTSDILAILPF
ncbi:hypothetical protein I8748_29295 [Nostoc sp. CENA67]|uniref:Uncharacterized protein n=1 Tax=Amazonocrinis nigriterrae CENA67 TaxID=2794033 RepID=A0A8J7LC74_9NOST|nr:hypothetical protein [Amazonocrinis nigriterrae]MBH8566206.1 hypothetical protein [Amazonocrinis nigriterrae CENA67]